MERRHFFTLMGGLPLMSSSADAAPRARYYLFRQYILQNGDQGGRLAAFLRDGVLPAAARVKAGGPRLVLESLVAAHMPQVLTVTPYSSLDEVLKSGERLQADEGYRTALATLESGAEPPYEAINDYLVEATDYSPELPASFPDVKPLRVFELRLYHSPTERQLKALHERFAGPETKIFHRSGVHPLLYSSTVIGPMKPNLVYLTPFEDLAAREKAWNAFGADPEWAKVRKESIEKSGQISLTIHISLYRAAAYSPLR
jgi:hypothetical protein